MPPPLRICFDLTPCEMRDRFGGFGRYAITLLRSLLALPAPDRDGLEILGLSHSDRPPTGAGEAIIASLATDAIISPWRHHMQRQLLVGRALRSARVDLFHSTTPAALPWLAGCPVVATVHDIIPVVCPEPGRSPLDRGRRLGDRLEQRLRLARADHLVAISNTTARDVMRVFGVPADRITVVRHGVDATAFNARSADGERDRLRRRHALPERYFIGVGSDHYRKNHRSLFDAWREVAATVPEGFVLVARAIHGGALASLVDDARRAGLGDRFRWLQDVTDDELPGLYRHATALVAPSLYEGFGMTLLESLACGTPVAASRTDAHLEVGGDAIMYFDSGAVAAIARALDRISTDEMYRADLRARGLARAAGFSWTRAAQETLEVYRRVATGPSRSGS